jgi:hypothetical protein
MNILSNSSNGVAAASILMTLASPPSTSDYRILSFERSARPLHDAYEATTRFPSAQHNMLARRKTAVGGDL